MLHDEVCSERIQPCTMKDRDIYWRRCKIQETLYVGQWHLSPLQNGHLGTSHCCLSPSSTVQNTAKSFVGIASAALLYFPEAGRLSEISSLSKVFLVLGKARSCKTSNLCCRGLSHLGDLMLYKKTAQDMMHEWGCIVVVKLPITSCP